MIMIITVQLAHIIMLAIKTRTGSHYMSKHSQHANKNVFKGYYKITLRRVNNIDITYILLVLICLTFVSCFLVNISRLRQESKK